VFWRLDRFSREGALATLRYPKELKDHGVPYTSILHRTLARLAGAVRRRDCLAADHHRRAGPEEDCREYAGRARQEESDLRAAEAPLTSANVTTQVQRLKVRDASNQVIARTLKIAPSTVTK
jgi:hypothetical protein